MAEIKNLGGQPPPPVERNAAKIADGAVNLPGEKLPAPDGETAVGRGAAGQPVGQPTTEPTTQNALMPNVVTGRDPSQLIAAEKMRSNAGHSATDVLLGLNRQPPALGAIVAPPGNIEALRHLSPAMRRTVLRNLLTKQRGQMRRLVAVMREDERQKPDEENKDEENKDDAATVQHRITTASVYPQSAVRDLEATTRMLDLLDELLGMQDYTLSQMGTFTQG